jgi:nicotinamidase-related amidase
MKRKYFSYFILPLILGSLSVYTSAQTTQSVLVVLDVQNGLVRLAEKNHGPEWDSDTFFDGINLAAQAFKKAQMPVLFVANEWDSPVKNIVTGNICKKGSENARFDNRLDLCSGVNFSKSKPSALETEEFNNYIINKTPKAEVYIAGFFAEACVHATAADFVRMGHKVFIIENLVLPKKPSGKKAAFAKLGSLGANIINLEDICSLHY